MKIINKNKKSRIVFVGSIFFISIFSLIFILINFKENMVFFYSPSEVNKIPNNKSIVRVGGMIKENSIDKIDSLNTDFIITDYQKDLLIKYHGILPDLFRDEQGVVAKGYFDGVKNIFFADELLVKHDENYMPPEVAKNLKMKISK